MLHGPAEQPVSAALVSLERGLPDLRALLTTELATQGIVGEATIARMGLPEDLSQAHPDQEPEAILRRAVRRAPTVPRAQLTPRIGCLVGLAVASHLEEDLFDDDSSARELADWVAGKDSVLRAVRNAIERAEGW